MSQAVLRRWHSWKFSVLLHPTYLGIRGEFDMILAFSLLVDTLHVRLCLCFWINLWMCLPRWTNICALINPRQRNDLTSPFIRGRGGLLEVMQALRLTSRGWWLLGGSLSVCWRQAEASLPAPLLYSWTTGKKTQRKPMWKTKYTYNTKKGGYMLGLKSPANICL